MSSTNAQELSKKLTGVIYPHTLVEIDIDAEEDSDGFAAALGAIPKDPYDENAVINALIDILGRHIPTDDGGKTLKVVLKELKRHHEYWVKVQNSFGEDE